MTLYEKCGRRYKPVSETQAYEGLPKGAWLVLVEPGMTSVRKCLDPDFAAVEAAMRIAAEAMVSAMAKSQQIQPATRELTAIERKAWQAYRDVIGSDVAISGVRCSLSDAVDAGIEELRKRMKAGEP